MIKIIAGIIVIPLVIWLIRFFGSEIIAAEYQQLNENIDDFKKSMELENKIFPNRDRILTNKERKALVKDFKQKRKINVDIKEPPMYHDIRQ